VDVIDIDQMIGIHRIYHWG